MDIENGWQDPVSLLHRCGVTDGKDVDPVLAYFPREIELIQLM